MNSYRLRSGHRTGDEPSPKGLTREFLFGPVVVRIELGPGVWEPTPHGISLGRAMAKAQHAIRGKSVLDVGTGTGLHAVTALKLGARSVDVSDIDREAIDLARSNAKTNDVELRHGQVQDWFDFEPAAPYDLILCNPPFCKAGTPDRRSFISRMIAGSRRFLVPGGHLLFSQSSMADFRLSESELHAAGFHCVVVHEDRSLFREYYFADPSFVEESRAVEGGFELIDGCHVETLRAYLCTWQGA